MRYVSPERKVVEPISLAGCDVAHRVDEPTVDVAGEGRHLRRVVERGRHHRGVVCARAVDLDAIGDAPPGRFGVLAHLIEVEVGCLGLEVLGGAVGVDKADRDAEQHRLGAAGELEPGAERSAFVSVGARRAAHRGSIRRQARSVERAGGDRLHVEHATCVDVVATGATGHVPKVLNMAVEAAVQVELRVGGGDFALEFLSQVEQQHRLVVGWKREAEQRGATSRGDFDLDAVVERCRVVTGGSGLRRLVERLHVAGLSSLSVGHAQGRHQAHRAVVGDARALEVKQRKTADQRVFSVVAGAVIEADGAALGTGIGTRMDHRERHRRTGVG